MNKERGEFSKFVDTFGKVEVIGGAALVALGFGVGLPIFLFGAGKLAALNHFEKDKK